MTELGRLVAVRFLDKRLLKGWTVDFRPNRAFFHLEEEGAAARTRVPIESLKAVFFIKSLGRNPDCVDKRSFEDRTGTEEKVWIEFSDGEKLAGWSNSFGSPKGGFYVFPADPDSNMEAAYVFRAAIKRMEQGEAAEEASRAFCRSSEGSSETAASAWESAGAYRFVRDDLRSRGDGTDES